MYAWINRTINFYRTSFAGLSREVWILSVVMLINRSGMMVIPFITLYATEDLGMTVVQAGILASMFGIGSLVGSLLGGWFTDRVGPYRVMLLSLIGGGIGFIVLAYFRSYYTLLTMIFIVSAITDMLRPALMTSVQLHSKPENKTRSISLYRMAVNLGISLGPAVGGVLAVSIGYFWLFVFDGITCLLAAGFLFYALKPKTKKNTEEEKNKSATSLSAYRDGRFLLFMILSFVSLVAFLQILSTVPLFLENELNLTELQVGLFFTLNGMLIFIFEMPIVATYENKYSKGKLIMIGALMIAVSHFCLNLPVHWFAIFMSYSLLVAFGEIINFPFSNSWALDRAGRGSIGQYMGLYTTMWALSFIVAPIVGTNLLNSYGYPTLWNVMGGLGVLSAIGFYFMYLGKED